MDDILLFGAASTAMKLALMFLRWNKRPKQAELVGRVTRLTLYPVKSMGGLIVEQAFCTYKGFQLPGTDVQDRTWMVIFGEENRFITAKVEPSLLLVKPSLNDDDDTISFDAPSMETLRIKRLPNAASTTIAKVFGEDVECWDCGDAAAEWISRYLGDKHGHRLVYHNALDHALKVRSAEFALRKVRLSTDVIQDKDKLTFQDGSPYLLTTEASLTEVNKKVPAGEVIPVECFRPSIIVNGNYGPFEEDNWGEVFIGDTVKFTTTMPCPRCVLTTIDPVEGKKRANNEPLDTLKSLSRQILTGSQSPCFGNFLVCDRPGNIRLNDPVYVIRRN